MGQNISKCIGSSLYFTFIDVTNIEEVHRKLLGSTTSSTGANGFVQLCKRKSIKSTGRSHFQRIDELFKPG